MAKRRWQEEHDLMIKKFAVELEGEGARNVKADINGYEKPDKITWPRRQDGHIPDITADGILVEVETADSIDDPHTEDQWTLFARHAQNTNQKFIIVVPITKEPLAWRRLRQLKVNAEVESI